MKKILCKIMCSMQLIGYARAASELTRMGKLKEAKELMLYGKMECSC